MLFPHKTYTGSYTDLITLGQIKSGCNIDVSTWDNMLPIWAMGVISILEDFINLAFLPSSVTLTGKTKVYSDFDNYIEIPYSNNAVLTGSTANKYTLIGDRIYTNDSEIDITYTCGGVYEDWMRMAVIAGVSDIFVNRGESKSGEASSVVQPGDVCEQAKQMCKGKSKNGILF